MIKANPKNKIKEFREGKGMKQTVLAIYRARKIAKVLGRTIDDIFYPDLSYSSDYDRLYQD
jgi:DNA-binding XRE family transcriptional regulator